MSMRSSRARASTVRRSRPWPAGLEQAARLDLARQRRARARGCGRCSDSRSGRAERLRRREDALHVHVEPAVHRLLDEVAAHHHQQQRRAPPPSAGTRAAGACGSARRGRSRRRSMTTRTRLRPSTSSSTSSRREVEDGQAVEEDGGQEVGREVAALPQQELHERRTAARAPTVASRTRRALLRNGRRGAHRARPWRIVAWQPHSAQTR